MRTGSVGCTVGAVLQAELGVAQNRSGFFGISVKKTVGTGPVTVLPVSNRLQFKIQI